MKWILKPIALVLFSYVRVYDKQGNLLIRKPIVSGNFGITLNNAIELAEGIENLELRVDKRGLRKLKGNIILEVGEKVGKVSLAKIDISKPLILNDLEQYFIQETEVDNSQFYYHEMTFLLDEKWIAENQDSFMEGLTGQAEVGWITKLSV